MNTFSVKQRSLLEPEKPQTRWDWEDRLWVVGDLVVDPANRLYPY
jgi:hypothetical protein